MSGLDAVKRQLVRGVERVYPAGGALLSMRQPLTEVLPADLTKLEPEQGAKVAAVAVKASETVLKFAPDDAQREAGKDLRDILARVTLAYGTDVEGQLVEAPALPSVTEPSAVAQPVTGDTDGDSGAES